MPAIKNTYQRYLEYLSAAQVEHRVVLKRERQLHTLTAVEFSRVWSNMTDPEQAVWSSKFERGYSAVSKETLEFVVNSVWSTARRAA